MQTIRTIGLDIAKSVFQVHGVDAAGQVVIRRRLKRRYVLAFFRKLPPCLISIEACASSHHWSRESIRSHRAANAAGLREAAPSRLLMLLGSTPTAVHESAFGTSRHFAAPQN